MLGRAAPSVVNASLQAFLSSEAKHWWLPQPARGLVSSSGQGPVQSNGICLLEFVVHSNR